MKRSYELLIAEALQLGGFMTNINDAIKHMSNGVGAGYSYAHTYHDDDAHYLITVVISSAMFIVFDVNTVNDRVTLMNKTGF